MNPLRSYWKRNILFLSTGDLTRNLAYPTCAFTIEPFRHLPEKGTRTLGVRPLKKQKLYGCFFLDQEHFDGKLKNIAWISRVG